MKFWGTIFGALGFLSVALGAFAAHGLKERLSEKYLAIFHTGVTYQFYHTLALGLVLVFLMQNPSGRFLTTAAGFFTAGIAIFSGSLYALALTEIGVLGAITPIGGVCFLIGWSLLAAHFCVSK
jgi:uncharacterized membrane protein YgdD (TMEM256/DUF423 family)